MGIRLHGVVRAHARHRRHEAARLGAHDVQIEKQKRPVVAACDLGLNLSEIQCNFLRPGSHIAGARAADAHHILGRVTPRCPWYFPPRSR